MVKALATFEKEARKLHPGHMQTWLPCWKKRTALLKLAQLLKKRKKTQGLIEKESPLQVQHVKTLP